MAGLIPPGREAELFGFYALCGKTAAILGPLVFGLTSRLTGGNQRIAIVPVGLFFVIALILVRGVDAGAPARERTPAHNAPPRRSPARPTVWRLRQPRAP